MTFHQQSLNVERSAVGQLIRELRQTLKLTQAKFAAHLGVTFPTINRWENGHAMPSSLALKQIETLLHQLCESPEVTLQERSKTIREKYFQLWQPKA